jgi:hypothetical protein
MGKVTPVFTLSRVIDPYRIDMSLIGRTFGRDKHIGWMDAQTILPKTNEGQPIIPGFILIGLFGESKFTLMIVAN